MSSSMSNISSSSYANCALSKPAPSLRMRASLPSTRAAAAAAACADAAALDGERYDVLSPGALAMRIQVISAVSAVALLLLLVSQLPDAPVPSPARSAALVMPLSSTEHSRPQELR